MTLTPQEAVELRMKGEANNRELACDICSGDGQRIIGGNCAGCSGTGRNEASCLLIEGAHEIEKLRKLIEDQQREVERLSKQAKCGHYALDKRTYSSCPCGFHQTGVEP